MRNSTNQTLKNWIDIAKPTADRPSSPEDAFECGRLAAKRCIEKGVPVDLRDEAPGIHPYSDDEAKGWNSMVFSEENRYLRKSHAIQTK